MSSGASKRKLNPAPLIQLRGRHADIHQHAIHTAESRLAHRLAHVGERAMHHFQSRVTDRSRGRDRPRVAIQRQQTPLGAKLLENRPAVAAASEGGVP